MGYMGTNTIYNQMASMTLRDLCEDLSLCSLVFANDHRAIYRRFKHPASSNKIIDTFHLQWLASRRQNSRPFHRHLPILPVQVSQIFLQCRTDLALALLTLLIRPEGPSDHWEHHHGHLHEVRDRYRHSLCVSLHFDIGKATLLELRFDPGNRVPLAITQRRQKLLGSWEWQVVWEGYDGSLNNGDPASCP